MAKDTFKDYWDALEPEIGFMLKETILQRAAENPEIGVRQLRQLHDKAYPEFA